jgi:ribosomal protein L11 methyltransferase
MSFGTGYHGTTRACLEMIDLLSVQLPGAAFLDAGCGSGILALAAAKLGFAPVRAFDSDPQAVAIARGNLERNGVEVTVDVADLAAYPAAPPCRVVVANILAPVLIAQAEKLVSFLDCRTGDSHLILSGILSSQYPDVRQRFQSLGGRETATRTLDEWTSGSFRFPQE